MSYFVKNSNLSSIQDIVNSFTQVITQQNALITTLQSGLSTGDTNLTTLVARVTANEATLGNLSTITANNGGSIGVLQSAYTTNRSDITTNASAIGVLQSASATNTSAIAATNTIVTSHTASIAALEVPGFVATPSTLHWDFRDFIDLKQGVAFDPIPSDGIEIIDQKAVADLPGAFHYLRAFVPIEFVSKFSKSLMFRFKSIAGMDPNVDFVSFLVLRETQGSL